MMKKALLPLAIAALMPMSAMAVGPIDGKIYGKINVTADSEDFSNGGDATADYDQWEINSNASRIGVKGKAELSEGFYAIYKAEFEVYVDDGDSGGSKGNDTFEQRNVYVGLSGKAGTIIVGKNDTPTKLAQKKIDLFGDLSGDIKNTFEGENRESNIVIYTTPKMNGFAASIAAVTSEGDDVDGDGKGDDGFDGQSLAVSYTYDDLYLALAADQDIDGLDVLRAVAQYKVGEWQFGFMYQDAESVLNNTDGGYKDEDGYFVSVAYKLNSKIKLKAQYGEIEGDKAGGVSYEEETLSLGLDYKLAKNTKLFGYYTVNTDDQTDNTEDQTKIIGVGVEHKF
jgi:predicted porin